jgi:hypothetical protein
VDEFLYDVAFSFLDQDKTLAHEFRQLLEPGLRVFVYDRQQEAVGGQDGAEGYARIFKKDARLSVILFRDGWGGTRFTGIEEAAIRDHATRTRFRSMMVVMVEPGQTLPLWIPDTTVWQHAWEEPRAETAAVIRARAREVGAVVHVETVLDVAKRRAAKQHLQEERKEFIASDRGARAAGEEVQRLFAELERQAAELTAAVPALDFRTERQQQLPVKSGCVISAPTRRLAVWWSQPFATTLNGAQLEVGDLPGGHARRGGSSRDAWSLYRFVLTESGEYGWVWHEDVDYSSSLVFIRTRAPEPESTPRFASRLLQRLVEHLLPA